MEDTRRSSRRPHSPQLKALVLAQCVQPGASVAKVAQAHGLNANLVHKWRRSRGATANATKVVRSATPVPHSVGAGAGTFMALALPPRVGQTALPDIRIEVQRGSTAVRINWPAQAGAECAAWLREWSREWLR